MNVLILFEICKCFKNLFSKLDWIWFCVFFQAVAVDISLVDFQRRLLNFQWKMKTSLSFLFIITNILYIILNILYIISNILFIIWTLCSIFVHHFNILFIIWIFCSSFRTFSYLFRAFRYQFELLIHYLNISIII